MTLAVRLPGRDARDRTLREIDPGVTQSAAAPVGLVLPSVPMWLDNAAAGIGMVIESSLKRPRCRANG